LVRVGVSVARVVTVGVQVAGKTLRGVGVTVGSSTLTGNVGGGKGLIETYGFTRIATTPTQTHIAIRITTTVRIFQIIAALSLVG
jgi:hypothetical protein